MKTFYEMKKASGAWLYAVAVIVLLCGTARADSFTPLEEHGYSALPQPQKVTLTGGDFNFGNAWRLELFRGVRADDVAVESLKQDLRLRYGLRVVPGGSRRTKGGVIRLAVIPRAVAIGDATDSEKGTLLAQAYRMVLKPRSISIIANAPQGLFYGVQTLLQLVRPEGKKFLLPAAEITDWPDLELRVIYWDDAHHLDRLDELKRALRQASFFKINGFAIKLEGHFQFRSAPAVVEPYALSPSQLQELTRYGLRYYVQVIPYLDAPAHVAFILKHPEYARLRAFPKSNYEFCVTNPDTYKLLFGMYNDLLAANNGSKYFLLSTDEPYYVGLASNSQCEESARAKELGSVGKLLAEFITKTANYLHDRGRTVIFWGEEPLKPDDIPSLPRHVVNGEVYGADFDPVFKQHGIRQMIYTSTQGEDPLFPDYFTLISWEKLHSAPQRTMRVKSMFDEISATPARKQAALMGVIIAAWADAGLHQETFWAGYAAGTAAGWHPGDPDPRDPMIAFFNLYYGPSAELMGRVYQLMSQQAQFWDDSWEWAPTTARKPIFGNSDGLFDPPRPARDQTLPLPPVPALPDLAVGPGWKQANDRRLQLVLFYLIDNGELIDLLRLNLKRARHHHYNLEVFLSIAQLCGHNLRLILDLGRIYGVLTAAHEAAARHRPEAAIQHLDRALDIAQNIRQDRNTVLSQAIATWYKTWHPRVEEANGRRFFHELDDVKDHRPDRTVDMSYLVYRELIWPFGEWVNKVLKVRNLYALENALPIRGEKLDWTDTKTILPVGQANATD